MLDDLTNAFDIILTVTWAIAANVLQVSIENMTSCALKYWIKVMKATIIVAMTPTASVALTNHSYCPVLLQYPFDHFDTHHHQSHKKPFPTTNWIDSSKHKNKRTSWHLYHPANTHKPSSIAPSSPYIPSTDKKKVCWLLGLYFINKRSLLLHAPKLSHIILQIFAHSGSVTE